jgi:hypothetical protein
VGKGAKNISPNIQIPKEFKVNFGVFIKQIFFTIKELQWW